MAECHISYFLPNDMSIACEIDRRSIPIIYLLYFVRLSIMGNHLFINLFSVLDYVHLFVRRESQTWAGY